MNIHLVVLYSMHWLVPAATLELVRERKRERERKKEVYTIFFMLYKIIVVKFRYSYS